MTSSPQVRRHRVDILPTAMKIQRERVRTFAGSGYLYIGGALLYLCLFVLYPMGRSLWLSVTNTTLLSPNGGSFIGLSNYRSLISSGEIVQSLTVTIIYVVVVTLVALVIGTAIAFLVDSLMIGKALARTLVALPWMIPTLVIGLLFSLIYNFQTGILNDALSSAGIGKVGWLTNNSVALWSVMAVTVWNLTPFVMLVSLAALQSIPKELSEASILDGAESWQMIRSVKLPLIGSTLRIISLFLVIWSFQQFQIIWLLTEGGPINGTNVLVINLYHTAFYNDHFGKAAAIGAIGLIPALVITVIYFVYASPMKSERR